MLERSASRALLNGYLPLSFTLCRALGKLSHEESLIAAIPVIMLLLIVPLSFIVSKFVIWILLFSVVLFSIFLISH